MENLLAKAKAYNQKKNFTTEKEVMEVAVAWAKEEISFMQAKVALVGKGGGGNIYTTLARALKEYVRQNDI